MSNLEEKYFVRAFLRFIQKQVADRHFSPDIVESLELASECYETAYDLRSTESDFQQNHPMAAVNLFELFQNSCIDVNISPARKWEAENLKNAGNCLMKEGKYQEALVAYSRAIALDATNPVFHCNRAAAYTKVGDYQRAVDDCKMSLRYDPTYSKAYGRLGLAYSELKKHQLAIEAYEKAISLDPVNSYYRNKMSVTKQRLEETNAANTPILPHPEGVFRNIDLAAITSNPAYLNMHHYFMTDPAMIEMISSLETTGSGESIFESLQQLVSLVQNRNPALYNSLLEQFGGVIARTGDGSTGDGNNPGAPISNEPPQRPSE